jgi:uncharacterized protein YecE (DUF72 family)
MICNEQTNNNILSGSGKNIFVGMSGYIYYHKNLLEYSKDLNSVEINNTFYKFPQKNISQKWFDQTPQDFKFVIKMNAYITHYKKLKNTGKYIVSFLEALLPLKNKLSCVLFQFPKNFQNNEKNLKRLIKLKKYLKLKINYAFEFRHDSWFNDNIYDFFKENNLIFVISNFKKFIPELSSKLITHNKIYIRMHGTTLLYKGSYDTKTLKKIIKFIKNNNTKTNYIFFNNTDSSLKNKIPDALHDALKLNKLIKNS